LTIFTSANPQVPDANVAMLVPIANRSVATG
jgi:hypothetical protein